MNNPKTQATTETAPGTVIPSPQIAVLPNPPPVETKPLDDQVAQPPKPARKRSRNGKIARLPYPQRDMVNRMLFNNVSHALIVGALEEHDISVTVRNVSNWKTRGGYEEWRVAQERAVEAQLRQDNLLETLRKSDASQLAEVGLQMAATQVSEYFLKPEAQQQLGNSPDKYTRTIAILCRVAGQIHALQKYRDQCAKELSCRLNPERVKREAEEDVEVTRNIYSSAKIGEEPNEPHRNYMPKSHSPPIDPRDD